MKVCRWGLGPVWLEGVSEGVSECRGRALGGGVGKGLGALHSRRESPRAED